MILAGEDVGCARTSFPAPFLCHRMGSGPRRNAMRRHIPEPPAGHARRKKPRRTDWLKPVNMNQDSIRKQFVAYAIPAVLGMVFSSLYSIVDGIFVGRGVGEIGLAAINIVFPLLMLQISLSMMIAVGGAAHFSAARGRGDDAAAQRVFFHSVVLLIVAGAVLNTLVLAFPAQVARLLGADDGLLPYVLPYMKWASVFHFIYLPGLGVSIFVRNDGGPGREMVGTISGGVANMVLDYLFIMVFDWGVAGAAVATGIGQILAVCVYLSHFLSETCTLRLRPQRWSWRVVRKILFTGSPSFLMEFSTSAVTYSYNLALMAHMGAMGVSAYSIVMYIASIFGMVLMGVVQGAQPLMSFHYGAGDLDDVQTVYRLGVKVNLTLAVGAYLLVFAGGRLLVSIFIVGASPVADLAVHMMRYFFLGYIPVGLTQMNILRLQTTGREGRSIVISALRCIGFVLVFLLVLPWFMGNTGIYLAFACGELCNFLVSVALCRSAAPVVDTEADFLHP